MAVFDEVNNLRPVSVELGCPVGGVTCGDALRVRIRSVTNDCGTPSLLAAALPPIDSAKRIALTLNSCVYCRFGTDLLLLISSFSCSMRPACIRSACPRIESRMPPLLRVEQARAERFF